MSPNPPLSRLGPVQTRLLADWMPGAWIGAARRAIQPQAELYSSPQGEVVESHPAHWLIALWRPQRLQQPFLRRWPHMASLFEGDDEARVQEELLRHVPGDERLLLVSDDIDWALVAEIVMLAEPDLRPFHYRALQQFIVDERAAASRRISESYSDHSSSYQRFVKTVPGAL
jgi:hypothetical protein